MLVNLRPFSGLKILKSIIRDFKTFHKKDIGEALF